MKNLIDTSGFEIFFYPFVFFVLFIIIGTWIVTASMARKRGYNQVIWFILAVLCPFYPMIFLAFLGETDEKRQERIMEEEQWRRIMRD